MSTSRTPAFSEVLFLYKEVLYEEVLAAVVIGHWSEALYLPPR
jgi:hypothetical protein